MCFKYPRPTQSRSWFGLIGCQFTTCARMASYLPAPVDVPVVGKVFSDPLVDLAEGHLLLGVLHRQADEGSVGVGRLGALVVDVVDLFQHLKHVDVMMAS